MSRVRGERALGRAESESRDRRGELRIQTPGMPSSVPGRGSSPHRLVVISVHLFSHPWFLDLGGRSSPPARGVRSPKVARKFVPECSRGHLRSRYRFSGARRPYPRCSRKQANPNEALSRADRREAYSGGPPEGVSLRRQSRPIRESYVESPSLYSPLSKELTSCDSYAQRMERPPGNGGSTRCEGVSASCPGRQLSGLLPAA